MRHLYIRVSTDFEFESTVKFRKNREQPLKVLAEIQLFIMLQHRNELHIFIDNLIFFIYLIFLLAADDEC